MRRYLVNDFYVGKLNFGFHCEDMLDVNKFTKSEQDKIDLEQKTIANGAININSIDFYNDFIDPNTLMHYDTVFTLFYKLDKENYICLHNNKVYNLNGVDYCSELELFRNYFPKMAFPVRRELTIKEIKNLFGYLFSKKEKELYNKEQFKIDEFYTGNLELCTKIKENDHEKNINEPLQLILANHGTLPYKTYRDSDKKTFSSYHVTLIKVNNEIFYNVNNYQMYNISEYNKLNHLDVNKPLWMELTPKELDSVFKTSIPKILKLQKKKIMNK